MNSKLLASTLFSVLISTIAWADQMGPEGDKFYEETAHYVHACKNPNGCQTPYRNEVIYNHRKEINRLTPESKEALKKISTEQAQIWGDTILEGDYVADGQTRLDNVFALLKNDQLVGYKILYSEKAWYIGDCEYDGRDESLETCAKGRIVESTFVSPDMQTFFSDEENQADFAFDSN